MLAIERQVRSGDSVGVEKCVDPALRASGIACRADPAVDPFLSELVDKVDPSLIVSGIGEQPAIEHLRDFRCNGFTAGCVCVAPALSMKMLRAIQAKDYAQAEKLRAINEAGVRLAREAAGEPEPDAGAGAGDDGRLACKLTHCCQPRRWALPRLAHAGRGKARRLICISSVRCRINGSFDRQGRRQ